MISKLIQVLRIALVYTKNHPQLLFVFALLIFLPLLFLYTGQQFLDVGRANQDRLQKDKVGVLHDAFSSLFLATDFDEAIAQKELSKIASQNPDIIDYTLSKQSDGTITPFVAMNSNEVGVSIAEIDLFINASLRTDESIIFEFYESDVRIWSAYRAMRTADGSLYFLYTKISLGDIDALFATREQKAYFSLIFVYCFVIALAYWHIRLTDYKYLYLKAEKANEMKDLFANMITHELRAPLTAIGGYAGLLSESLSVESQKIQALRIKDSATRLLGIVNDLLDVARIQSGKLSFVKEHIDISLVVMAVLHELSILASQKNITLSSSGIDTSHMVHTDAKRIQQALTNIVSNALKHTEKGEITITVEDMHACVELRVKDTGMGISSDDQQKLFAPFFRVSNTDVSTITGTGLGMWITKELVELLGAKIGVESIKGVGTHIVISFPKDIRIS